MNTEIIVSQFDVNTISTRFPNFELSYETISHKKVYPNYNLILAIPVGKKYYAWFSFYKNEISNTSLDLFKTRIEDHSSTLWEKLLRYGVTFWQNHILDFKRLKDDSHF